MLKGSMSIHIHYTERMWIHLAHDAGLSPHLDMKLQVLVHGVDVVEDVSGNAGDDSHQLGVVELPLENRNTITADRLRQTCWISSASNMKSTITELASSECSKHCCISQSRLCIHITAAKLWQHLHHLMVPILFFPQPMSFCF